MSENQTATKATSTPGGEEALSALFAELVMQQANMAMMLMGKTKHPDAAGMIKDLDAARLFIDQLEMLETKTKGNLTTDESALLKQTLMSLRLAFVEAVEASDKESSPVQPQAAGREGKAADAAPAAASPPGGEEDHHKKFSKKY